MSDSRPAPAPCQVVCIASWNADLVSRIARPLARGETLTARGFEVLPGGKGSNAAIACARQGAATAVVARTGADAFGDMALALWAAEGIDASCVERAEGEASGTAQILVYDDGDNSIAVSAGATAGLGPRQVAAAQALIASARVVMASLEVPQQATRAAFEQARADGAITLLNPAPAAPLDDGLLALCDVLTPNEGELLALAGESTPDAAARALIARGAGAVVATLGAAGCRAWLADGSQHAVAGWRMPAVVDTVGAGDTFTGALAAALARGESLQGAMAWANAAAALSVTGRGATGGMPSLERTRALLGAD